MIDMKRILLMGAVICALGMMSACKNGTITDTDSFAGKATDGEVSEETKPMVFKENNLYGLKDQSGKILLNPEYGAVWETDGKYYEIHKGTYKGLVDRHGNFILQPEYNSFGYLLEGLRLVGKDGLYGWVDEQGKVVIPFKWTFADDFKDGKAYVEQGDSSYYINKQGQIISNNTDDYEQDFGKQLP